MRALAIVLLLAPAVAAAQTGPRTGGPAPADFTNTQLGADLSIAGNAARGLVDRDLVTARGTVTFWTGPWGAFVQPYWLYGDVGGMKTDDERYLRAAVFRALARPIFTFVVGVYDQSLRRKIDRRGLAGGGFGATLVDTKPAMLLASLSLLDEVADLAGTTRRTGRTALRLYGRYKLPGAKLVLLHDVYFLPAIRDVHDVRVLLSGVAEIPITAGIAARVQVDASYEQVIVPGTKHGDTALTFGFSYRGGWTP